MKHKRTLLILAGIIFLFLLQLLLLHRLSPLLSRDGIAYVEKRETLGRPGLPGNLFSPFGARAISAFHIRHEPRSYALSSAA